MSFQERKEKEPQAYEQAEGERGRNDGHEGSRDEERLESIEGVPGRTVIRYRAKGRTGCSRYGCVRPVPASAGLDRTPPMCTYLSLIYISSDIIPVKHPETISVRI